MKYKLIASPAIEPITKAEAKLFLNLDADLTADDDLVTSLIKAVRMTAEQYLNQKLITQTWDAFLDEFPDKGIIEIPFAPVQSITHVKYYTDATNEETFSDTLYSTDVYGCPARIKAYTDFPSTYSDKLNAVSIRYIIGYGDAASDIPVPIINGMMLLLRHLYDNRSDVVVGSQVNELPMGSRYLFDFYRNGELR